MSYEGKDFDERLIKVSNECNSAAEAAMKLGIRFTTYKRHAERLKVYKTNQSGKGISKPKPDYCKYDVNDILNGKQPQFQTGPLKRKLFESGIKRNICEECGISEWNGKPLVCQLDHINGNRNDHRIENLRILCPNCHSQTVTYRGKNKGCKQL